MFKKKPNIKTLSPLRSSDRRKTADRIISDYDLQIAQQDPPSDDAATTAARSTLRNSILPDNTLSAKFETTHGPDLKKLSGTVFVGSHGKNDQRVLWIKLEDVMYPSVYTLWHNPGIIPLLHTPSHVIEKLQGGADLMTPGLAGPPFPAKATKGAIVAVASLDHPSVPLVVGTCLIDISTLTKAQGAKGQAVETFHWSGDHIWDWSTSGKAGSPAPAALDGWETAARDLLAEDLESLELEDQTEPAGGVPLDDVPNGVADDISTKRNPHVDGEDVIERVDEEDIPTAKIDEVFRRAFLYGVHHQQQSNPTAPKFGFAFPLTQSFVISNLINPFLPAFTTQQTEAYVIKKTSWKNAKKFIKQLDKDKLIFSKDTKTEVVILDIDFEDPQIRDFKPYQLPKKETPVSSVASNAEAPAGSDVSLGQKLKVITLYKPKDSIAPLFKAADAGTKSSYTKAELVPIITHYVESANLVSPTNKRIVSLDPFLANSIFNTTARSDNEILAKGSVPRDILIDRVLASCAPFHSIESSSSAAKSTAAKPKSGLAPRIEIILETRSGNKTATRVHGFEPYFIQAQPLADELRKTCAGSTSAEPYKASKGDVKEVMVQGPQRDSVIKALEKRGVSRTWIDVLDKTKKK